MKKLIAILLLYLFTFNNFHAQDMKSSRDSINVFYNKIFYNMERGYLYKKDVNWREVKKKVSQDLTSYKDFKSSLKEVATVFNFAKADHCAVYYHDSVYTGKFLGVTEKDFSESWLKKYKTDPKFEVKVLDNEIGYILMPGINLKDKSGENITKISQPMYDEINKIKSENKIKGWILDLRFNTGGDCAPMILALYDFLGNNNIW